MPSRLPDPPPLAPGVPSGIEALIVPRTSDVGGVAVRRALPSRQRRLVGPFVFLDQMGPAVFRDGQGIDVAPHPHVGLATVTYLLEGELLHRDSLGTVQVIRPGAVNWMTAGRGIVHSERTPAEARSAGGVLAGLQTWVALPRDAEEVAPSFAHTPAGALPALEGEGVRARVVLGALFGARSPVPLFSDTVLADLALDAGARVSLPADHEERAVYVAAGGVEEGGATFAEGRLLVLRAGAAVVLRAEASGARLVLLGGAALDGPRHVFWNFVSSRPERIEQAAADWAEGRFGAVPGETEAIPLPARPRIVAYP